MALDDLADVLRIGREYRALLRAELGLQQQVIAALRARLHVEEQDPQEPPQSDEAPVTDAGDQDGRVSLRSYVSPSVLNGVSGVQDQEAPVTHIGTVPTPEALPSFVPVSALVLPPVTTLPAWLTRVPKGIAATVWQPAALLERAAVARILYGHCLTLAPYRQAYKLALTKSTCRLPIWTAWGQDVRGIGAYGLGRVLAETGDLWWYATVAKLWKRLGVGLWQGERQRRHLHITEEEARAIGYVAYRRAIVYNLQEGLIKQNRLEDGSPGPYYACYLARKLEEARKVPEGPPILWHRRASRYMGKRFLRDLWCAWRDIMPYRAVPGGGMGGEDQRRSVTRDTPV